MSKKLTQKEFAELLGVDARTLRYRLSKGMSLFSSCFMTKAEAIAAKPKKHGMHDTPEYTAWESMHSRCKRHPHYVVRGIKVCDEWKTFENFYRDMGPRPDGMSLDRFPDQLGDYSPSNCRWATPREQSQNTARNRVIEINGESKVVAEWARIYSINERTVALRLDRGYSPLEALTLPAYSRKKHEDK